MGATIGKLLLLVGSTIQYFRGLSSGWMFYNAQTEEITVQNPPFISSNPTETEFGFLAKVTSEVRRSCDPVTGEITATIMQQLSSQVLNATREGLIVVASFPECGQLSGDAAVDADKQMRLDYLTPDRHEGCEAGVGFLIRVPKAIQGGRNAQIAYEWRVMEQMRMRASQLGLIASGADEMNSALPIVAVPVSGGTDADPCYRLKILNMPVLALPTDAEVGDTITWNGTKWVKAKRGITYFPLETPVRLTSSAGTATKSVTMLEYPTDAVGRVFARLRIHNYVAASGAVMTSSLRVGNQELSIAHTNDSSFSNDANSCMQTVEITSKQMSFVFTKTGSGVMECHVDLLGYEY